MSTNIIETGLDIPNANTMIINNAHQYGLSDLHPVARPGGAFEYQGVLLSHSIRPCR
ncbi:MAG: hypothetical protein IPJ06_12320 [Saprospiraceae bacterium]|nr:hypothetical protein [Saprospiraceae bacterium]